MAMLMTTHPRDRNADHAGDDVKPHPNPTFREAGKARRVLAARTEHPLGVGADPLKDHRTEANRQALIGCLYGFFDGSLATTINAGKGTGEAVYGLPLGNRMVSALEIDKALSELRAVRNDLYLVLWRCYKLRWSWRRIGERVHKAPRTIREETTTALDLLVGKIWVDEE